MQSLSLAQVPFADESPVKADVGEAVFRYMFEHYNYGDHVKVFCIAAERRPQPESFIKRFAGNGFRLCGHRSATDPRYTVFAIRRRDALE